MESARESGMPVLRELRELVRRWWGLEVWRAGPRAPGRPGRPPSEPPASAVCARCLADPDGLARCEASIAEAAAAAAGGARLTGTCHQGFDMAAAPLGEGRSALVACGPLAADARERARLLDLLSSAARAAEAAHEEARAREGDLSALRRELDRRFTLADLTGRGPALERLRGRIAALAAEAGPVLLVGEPGTGKSRIARILHQTGPRRDRPFVAQDCAELDDAAFEARLFGRGGPAGGEVEGLLHAARGGTLFLHEVSALSPALQVKVLRLLDEGTFVPLGGAQAVRADVRVLASTAADLRARVARRELREDLFYRLSSHTLEVPPLRARPADLPLLVEQLLEAELRRAGGPRKKLHPQVLAALVAREWPGNVRELEDEVARLVALAGDACVIGSALAAAPFPRVRAADAEGPSAASCATQHLANAVARLEREMIEKGLHALHGNRSRLASLLGVSRTTLLRKIRDYGIVDAPPARDERGDA